MTSVVDSFKLCSPVILMCFKAECNISVIVSYKVLEFSQKQGYITVLSP